MPGDLTLVCGRALAVSDFKYGDEHMRKPSVTRREEQPVYGLTTSKNFITSNAIENILTDPPRLSQPGSDQVPPI
jgi:hypothetical protein